MAMKDYLLQAQPASSQPLFAFVRPKQRLTWNNLKTELRTVLQQRGFPTNNFYSHSFHIGAPTTATKAGLLPWLFKVLGHWRWDCYKRYIRTPKCTIVEVPSLLANTSPLLTLRQLELSINCKRPTLFAFYWGGLCLLYPHAPQSMAGKCNPRLHFTPQ